MAKRLFLLLFSSFMGIIGVPELLASADSFEPVAPEFYAVETVVEPEPEAEAPTEVATASTISSNYVAPTLAPVYIAPANNIAIAGRVLEVVDVADTTVDAGNHVNRYGGKFFYGHNSGAVFGGLTSVGEGSVFSVTSGGVTTNYQVAKVVIFEKNDGKLQLNGNGSFMNAVAGATHLGVHYSVAVMTCYGTSYGNGDASHRLVLFANAV